MAIAAAAAEVHPSPPPPARRTVAWFACTHLVCTAVICLFLASLWLLFWGWAIREIGWLACGEGCAVVTAGFKVVYVAEATLVLVLPVNLLVARMVSRSRAKPSAAVPVAAAATDIEATKEPALKTSYAAMLKTSYVAIRRVLRDPVALAILASMAFALLMLIALLVIGDNVIGSRRNRIGSVIYHVGLLGMNAVNCFVLWPLIAVSIWRSWMKAQHALCL